MLNMDKLSNSKKNLDKDLKMLIINIVYQMGIAISTPFLARFTPLCRFGCRVTEALYKRFFMVHPDR